MHGEVCSIVTLQCVAHAIQLVAIPDASLPSILLHSIDVKEDGASIHLLAIGPVVVRIDFGIQCKLSEKKVYDRSGDSSIVVASLV